MDTFSAAMLDLMTENAMRDDKLWFTEHKAQFAELVTAPMKHIADALLPYIQSIDEHIDKVHISRIYRDTRFLNGRSRYRENMWVSFGREKDLYKAPPAFYFDISPAGAEYGCGCYVPPDGMMQLLRETILAGDPAFIKANDALAASAFELYGDKYKRSRYPDAPEEQREWLERKNIGVFRRRTDWDTIFSEGFADEIGKEFAAAAPIYDFILKTALIKPVS